MTLSAESLTTHLRAIEREFPDMPYEEIRSLNRIWALVQAKHLDPAQERMLAFLKRKIREGIELDLVSPDDAVRVMTSLATGRMRFNNHQAMTPFVIGITRGIS